MIRSLSALCAITLFAASAAAQNVSIVNGNSGSVNVNQNSYGGGGVVKLTPIVIVPTKTVKCDVPCDKQRDIKVEWICCDSKVTGFYEICGGKRIAKWVVFEGSVKKSVACISGTQWVSQSEDWCGHTFFVSRSTSCGCGCYVTYRRVTLCP